MSNNPDSHEEKPKKLSQLNQGLIMIGIGIVVFNFSDIFATTGVSVAEARGYAFGRGAMVLLIVGAGVFNIVMYFARPK